MRCLILVATVCATTACSNRDDQTGNRILAISFPGAPNPPTKNLVRGTQDLGRIDPNSTEEGMLTEAFLRCGLRRLSWTEYGSDGASRLIIPDNEQTRSAVKCVAKAFPLDFYVEPQLASKTDVVALAQTPQ